MRFFCVACVFGILVALASFVIQPPIDSSTPRSSTPELEISNFVSTHRAAGNMAAPLIPSAPPEDSAISRGDSVQLTTVSN